MKKNSLIVVLIIIIVLLISYIVYDKLNNISKENNNLINEVITILDTIDLDYVKVYLASDGSAYIIPLNNEEINKLEVNNNLKDRLKTLYDRAFYFDVYVDNYKIKGFRVKLDKDITKIRKLEIDNNFYIVFIKENNTIGLFNNLEYIDLLYTNVIDNYNDYQNVLDIKDNKIEYLDGFIENFKLEK